LSAKLQKKEKENIFPLPLRKIFKPMKKISFDEYMSAVRRGSREAELLDATGWRAKERPHKNRKKYDRKTEKASLRREAFSFVYRGATPLTSFRRRILRCSPCLQW
jgi:hypothetical protein